MCKLAPSTDWSDFVDGVHGYLTNESNGVHCENRPGGHGFWIKDPNWTSESGQQVGFGTACSCPDERNIAVEKHSIYPCFHLPSDFLLKLDLQDDALLAMKQRSDAKHPGYIHLWICDPKTRQEIDISGTKYSPEFGSKVLRLLKLIHRPV